MLGIWSRGKIRLIGGTDHGIPTSICCWTVMKKAKMPSTVADAAMKMRSQKLSCASGQWYFFRRSTTSTSVIVVDGVWTEDDQEEEDRR